MLPGHANHLEMSHGTAGTMVYLTGVRRKDEVPIREKVCKLERISLYNYELPFYNELGSGQMVRDEAILRLCSTINQCVTSV